MHQQRRISPAPSSPCPRIQQSNRMQFLQPYVVQQQPIVLKTEELRPVPQPHHQSREREKENLNPKALQSVRLLSQHDTPRQQNDIQNLREEMLKLFELHRKEKDTMKQELELCKSEIIEHKAKSQELKAELQLQKQINDQLKADIEIKLQTQQEEINKLNEELSLVKQELQVQKQEPQQVTLDTYDTYIQKYEQFNKQVNDYLLNRKLPDSEYTNKLPEGDYSQLEQQQTISMSKADMDRYKMSTIHEHENEEDEIIYQVDENGYVMNQDGNHLVDNYGRLIQLSEKDIEYFKSKNQLDEIK